MSNDPPPLVGEQTSPVAWQRDGGWNRTCSGAGTPPQWTHPLPPFCRCRPVVHKPVSIRPPSMQKVVDGGGGRSPPVVGTHKKKQQTAGGLQAWLLHGVGRPTEDTHAHTQTRTHNNTTLNTSLYHMFINHNKIFPGITKNPNFREESDETSEIFWNSEFQKNMVNVNMYKLTWHKAVKENF